MRKLIILDYFSLFLRLLYLYLHLLITLLPFLSICFYGLKNNVLNLVNKNNKYIFIYLRIYKFKL